MHYVYNLYFVLGLCIMIATYICVYDIYLRLVFVTYVHPMFVTYICAFCL